MRVWNPPWSDYRHGANTEALLDLEGACGCSISAPCCRTASASLLVDRGGTGRDLDQPAPGVLASGREPVLRPVRRVKVPRGDDAKYPKGGTTSLLNSLRDAVLHGTPAETRAEDNIWNVAMVEAGKRSDQEGRTVPIAEVFGRRGQRAVSVRKGRRAH